MAMVDRTRELEPREERPIGWDGRTALEMLDRVRAAVRRDRPLLGPRRAGDARAEPIRFEKIFSRLRGGLVTARETALNISASPIVKEIGELCFALYTPEGDSVALSTGIIVHVHTMSDAIKYMIRQGYEDNPGIEPGDIFTNNDAMIGDVHNADVQTIVPIFWEGELIGWAAGVTHEIDIGAKTPGLGAVRADLALRGRHRPARQEDRLRRRAVARPRAGRPEGHAHARCTGRSTRRRASPAATWSARRSSA